MKAYYGSKFSPNMTETPEGFLVCHNVPIARTGWYEYLGDEIGADGKEGQIVKVYRDPEEVFKPAAMASFEGKPTTDEHPMEWVTPENVAIYCKGTAQNIRRSADEPDLLIADLMIYDSNLISEIKSGKREVSCGYDCVYVDNGDGTYSQRQICGNHVAVVKEGRAGSRVAIKDSKSQKKEGEKKIMSKKLAFPKANSRVTDILAALGLKHYATDAEPEEIMDAVNAMAEEKGELKEKEDGTEEKKDPETKDSDLENKDDPLKALATKVDKLTEIVTKLVESDKEVHKEVNPEDAIDNVIAELSKDPNKDDDVPDEESVTISPEEMNEDDAPVAGEKDKPKNPIPGEDNAYKIAALKAMKPVIAAITDPEAKKKACDALIASVKKPAAKDKNTYASIVNRQKKAAKDKQNKDTKEKDYSKLGKDIAKKYNPHYKEVK
jgi:hypothetical protein